MPEPEPRGRKAEGEAERPHPGAGGVFGRRAGRKLRLQQKALVATLLPRIEIDLRPAITREELFPGLSALHLEIGFGGGEFLARHAQSRPDVGFIGCEPFRNGVAKLLERVETLGLANVRVFAGDAGLLIDRLPDAALAGVDLFYPDPWPKRRQRKRRFVSDDVLRRLARVTAAGACLRFATDIDDYAGWTLARITRSPFLRWDPNAATDWQRPWPDWASTRYEAKAIREGRRPAYFTFVRTEAPWAPAGVAAASTVGSRE